MTFEVLGEPKGKGRPRFATDRKGYARAYTPKETAEYEDMIRQSFLLSGGKKTIYPVKVKIVAYLPIPKNFSKAMRIQAISGMLLPQKKPDSDNIEKVVFDALNGYAYRDDTQIVQNTTMKFYGDEPKIVVEITEADTIYYKSESGKWKRKVNDANRII